MSMPGPPPVGGVPDQPPPLEADRVPAPGELGIVGKRSWKTWQLAVGMAIAVLVGMALNYHTVGASGSSGSSGQKNYALPPPSGGATSTTTTLAGGASGATSTTTTLAGSSTTTSSTPSSATTTSVASTPARLLLGPTQSQGDWNSPAFTITQAGWNIGWAFRCTPAPVAGPSFQVSIAPVGTSPTGAPAITETGASGQAVTAESTTGQQILVVQAPASCAWAIKVTGS